MVELFQFLAAVDEAHNVKKPLPLSIRDCINFWNQSLSEEEVLDLAKRVEVSDRSRQRLMRVGEVIGSDLAFSNDPFTVEVRRYLNKGELGNQVSEPPLVGRQREISKIQEWLSGPRQMFVLTGQGGVGKTRLLHESIRLAPQYRVIEISGRNLLHQGDVVRAVARTLDLDSKDVELVRQELATLPTLLLADRFDGKISWLDALVNGVPHLKVMVTSRAFDGGMDAEAHELRPLTEEDSGEETAVSMFLGLVRLPLVTERMRSVIREICLLTNGLPLSIAVAAGSVHVGDLDQIAQNLRTFASPTQSMAPGQSVHQVIQLLARSDQSTLHALTLFPDAFRYEDAQWVSGLSDDEFSAQLTNFLRFGLVSTNGPSYVVHETIQEAMAFEQWTPTETRFFEFAGERLQVATVMRAEEVGHLMSQGQWQDGIRELHDYNTRFRVAIQRSIEEDRDHDLERLALGLSRTYFEAGYLEDFRVLAASALELRFPELTLRMKGLTGALASIEGDDERCVAEWTSRLNLALAYRDIAIAADAYIDLAWQDFEQDRRKDANAKLDQAEELCRQSNSVELLATVFVIRARMAAQAKDFNQARLQVQQVRELIPDCQDQSLMPFVYQGLGRVFVDLGEQAEAIESLRSVLRIAAQSHRAIHTGRALLALAPLYENVGDAETARQCFMAAAFVLNEYRSKDYKRARKELEEFGTRHPQMSTSLEPESVRETWESFVSSLL